MSGPFTEGAFEAAHDELAPPWQLHGEKHRGQNPV